MKKEYELGDGFRALTEEWDASTQESGDQEAFQNHIGQEVFKAMAQIHLNTIESRGGIFPHVLFYGNAGLGKTTLAKVLAKTLGGRFRFYIGEDLKPKNMHSLISEIQENDVVFIDEIHSIHPGGAEIFYDVVQDFLYMGTPVPAFTLIGGTTDKGKVPKPLRDRMWSYKMQNYTMDQLTSIVLLHYPGLHLDAAKKCAERSLDIPRLAVNIAKHVEAAQGAMSPEEVFALHGIDESGLLVEHLDVLRLLLKNKRPVGVEEISFHLDIPIKDIKSLYETSLMKLGYITRTPRGRVITQNGIQYLERREEVETNDGSRSRGEH